MANPEHVSIILKGVEAWNAWRAAFRKVRPDLSGADLSNRFLASARLVNADLEGANLERADLTEARLMSANLKRAVLTGASLAGANLCLADLTDARGLTSKQLASAYGDCYTVLPASIQHPTAWQNFEHALAEGALSANAWRMARNDQIPSLAGFSFADRRLRKVNLSRTDLIGCDFSRADLCAATFSGSNLDQCDFTDANMSQADLTRTSLKGVDLGAASGLAQEQLEVIGEANGETRFPPELTRPLHLAGLRSTPLIDDLNFEIRRSSLRPYLNHPLSNLLRDGHAFVILSDDWPPHRFTSEGALPPIDLRKANAIFSRPNLSLALAETSIAAGPFAGWKLALVGTINFSFEVLIHQSEQTIRAQMAARITRGMSEVLDHAQGILGTYGPPLSATQTSFPLLDTLADQIVDSRLFTVTRLEMRLTPPIEMEPHSASRVVFDQDSVNVFHQYNSEILYMGDLLPNQGAASRQLDGPARDVAVQTAMASVPSEFDKPRVPDIPRIDREDVFPNLMLKLEAYDPRVVCSVFAPPQITRRQRFKIQVFFHRKELLIQVAREAMHQDRSARRRKCATLETELYERQKLTVYIESDDLDIEEPLKDRVWWSPVQSVSFDASWTAREDKHQVEAIVHIALDDIPVGEISFELSVEAIRRSDASSDMPAVTFVAMEPQQNDQSVAPPAIAGRDAVRYKSAFLSYSRKDVAYASIFAEGLTSNGIELFVDVTTLEPGDDWKAKLVEGIHAADVFFVLWSENAAHSKWVNRECAEACLRWQAARNGGGKPISIRPIALGESLPKPPYCLSEVHSDSRWRAMRLAGEHPLFR
jgi:uncharacterized protein YjbI with pentapeptide repeats